MMPELITAILLVCGGVFALVAALGVVRLPDTIIRMHAATKAGTLGAGLIVAAVSVHAMETAVTLRALAALAFLLLTAPVAAHLIGRAAYRSGVRLWKGTWIDELAETSEKPGASDEEDLP